MKTAVLICPGRGTYNAPELGYLARHFPDPDLLAAFDALRSAEGQEPVSALDARAKYSPALHTSGEHASALIYAATLGDIASLARDEVEIVAVTGNSMGWYSALAAAGALSLEDGFTLVNTMGRLMQAASIGGQTIYPVAGDDWRPDPARRRDVSDRVAEINAREDADLALSIDLGGMLVLAGNEVGLSQFEGEVPKIDNRFPMRLRNHAAFHTELQTPVAEHARTQFSAEFFGQPKRPLVDGRGHVWWPYASDHDALRSYTLGHQITEPYDFCRAVTVAAREFAPDYFIVTGPGTTLGASVAQSLIAVDWQELGSKADFQTRQSSDPFVISMGREDQRHIAAAPKTHA